MFGTAHSRRRRWSPARHRKSLLGGLALVVAAGLALAGPLTAATAAGAGGVKVQTSQTVKANLTNTGEFDSGHVFTQVSVTGKGAVVVKSPTSTKALRNLNGFGAPTTEGGKSVYNVTVDGGTKKFRTVADYDKDLPVSVDIAYRLDGQEISPDDLAGKSGRLDVSYTIKNVSATPTDITYPDGHGKDVDETVNLVTPYVGQLAVTLPESFRQVGSDDNRADQAGDGHGGRIVTWTMVLFEPIGSIVQKFGYTADVTDAVIPPAHMQIVPVTPERHPELKFGQDGFSSGAQSGRDVTEAGVQIDVNLLKLQGGARKLLAGMTQLQAGASQLATGLVSGADAAIPGSQQLAAGAQTAADGSTELADGADQVAAGNAKLAAGLNELAGGAGQLSAGADQLATGFNDPTTDKDLTDGSQALAAALGLISGGLKQLNNAQSGLPAARTGAVALQTAMNTQIIPAIGTLQSPCSPTDKTQQTLISCQQAVAAGLPAAKAGVDQVSKELSDSKAPTAAAITGIGTAIATAAAQPGCSADPVCAGQLAGALAGLSTLGSGLNAGLDKAVGGLGQISAGLASAIAGVNGVRDGLLSLRAGLTNADFNGGKSNPACNPAVTPPKTGYCGFTEGLAQLVGGLNQAVVGLDQLDAGASQASTGAGDLADGIATAGGGAAQLSAGLKQLGAAAPDAVSGANQLADGSQQVADGADELSTGLNDQLAPGAAELAAGLTSLQPAADGAQQLADGLTQAQDGNQQIVDGAGELSARGSKKLIEAGDDTAKTFAREYAIMQALNVKGAANNMPFGAVKGSNDSRGAYDISIAGVGHQGTGSSGRGLAAIGIMAIGALASTLLRGRIG